VKPVPDQSFDGVNACEPEPVVVDPATEQKLVKGTDYALSYTANDRAGNATVTVTGLNAWSGHEVTVPFLICSSDAYRLVEYIRHGHPVHRYGITIQSEHADGGDLLFVGTRATFGKVGACLSVARKARLQFLNEFGAARNRIRTLHLFEKTTAKARRQETGHQLAHRAPARSL
jgi:hypothetical protein